MSTYCCTMWSQSTNVTDRWTSYMHLALKMKFSDSCWHILPSGIFRFDCWQTYISWFKALMLLMSCTYYFQHYQYTIQMSLCIMFHNDLIYNKSIKTGNTRRRTTDSKHKASKKVFPDKIFLWHLPDSCCIPTQIIILCKNSMPKQKHYIFFEYHTSQQSFSSQLCWND